MIPGAETSATLLFGPGRYRFFLPLKAIVELERLCGDKPIGVIYDEISGSIGLSRETDDPVYLIGGTARAKDAYQVIRLAAQYGAEGRPYPRWMPLAWSKITSTAGRMTSSCRSPGRSSATRCRAQRSKKKP
jgi:hypothetical protein